MSVLLIGLLARGIAFALVGVLLCLAFRRLGPAAGAGTALASLTGLVAVSALALSPWPRWWTLAAPGPAPAQRAVPTAPIAAARDLPGEPSPPVDATLSLPAIPEPAPATPAAMTPAAAAAPSSEPRAGAGWPSWIAGALALGAGAGLIHLGIGLAGVALLTRRARPIADEPVLDEIDLLRAELGCAGRVDVLESAATATPATVGWLRPVLLLPADWKAWDDRERRAILVHELAHVRRGDYLAGLWARLCLCLNFYNPLAHWLARRMWVQQELAADAWAAALSGGSRPYLATLARMALRCDERPAGWPSRAFLPTGTAFLRRIQMLRDAREIQPAAFSARARALALAVLLGAGLALGGLRGPVEPARAQEPARADAPAAAPGEFRLDLVPREAGLVVALRPAELLARPELAPIKELIAPKEKPPHSLNMPPAEIEQATLVGLTRPGPAGRRGRMFDLVILRARGPQDWKAVAGTFIAKATEVPFAGRTYVRAAVAPIGECYAILDDRTIVTGQEADIQLLLTDLTRPHAARAWDEPWKGVAKGQIAVAVESPWLTERFLPPPGQPAGPPGALASFGPLFDKAYAYAIGVDALNGLKVDALASCITEPGAEKVAETLGALRTLAANMLASSKGRIEGVDPQTKPLVQTLLAQAETLLDKARVVREGRTVSVRARSDMKLAEAARLLAPILQTVHGARKRTESVNNLKQIGLALHNYHAVNNMFPPAVLLGPDGKTPHSWRVAILPYLDQESLYKQYKFDEPWDGPNNIKLANQMPAVYSASGAAGTTSYFALTGPETIFAGPKGSGIFQITDGTSNTLLVVEAKRDIPWTKPEDIPYSSKAPLPELGGFSPDGFNALLADGSVRFLKSTIDPNVLRALITKAGGEVIRAD